MQRHLSSRLARYVSVRNSSSSAPLWSPMHGLEIRRACLPHPQELSLSSGIWLIVLRSPISRNPSASSHDVQAASARTPLSWGPRFTTFLPTTRLSSPASITQNGRLWVLTCSRTSSGSTGFSYHIPYRTLHLKGPR